MRKLLAIGIDNYSGNLKLKGRADEAQAFADLMATHEDGQGNFAVKTEKNVSTVAELNKIIRTFFKGQGSTAVLYFTGHGINNETGSYLVTPDYEEGNEGVSMDSILTILGNSDFQDKIIILDCCHSGAFGMQPNSGGVSATISKGTVILAASTSDERAFIVNGKGVFTNLLLEALKGGAADIAGNITPGGVYAYIDRAMGPFDLQRPVFKANVSRFTVLRKVVPRIPQETLKKLIEYFKEVDSEYPLNPSFEFTNEPGTPPYVKEPYAIKENVDTFKILQKFQGIGFVEPVGAEFMFFAAMDSKACKLTPLGQQYWKLIKEGKLNPFN
jgi:hypothetical protein